MPRGHGVGLQGVEHVAAKVSELDCLVAQHVGVGRLFARLVGLQKGHKDVGPVLTDELDVKSGYVQVAAHCAHVLAVAVRRAGALVLLILRVPVLHEDSHALMSLLLEQQRAHRRVDAARHGHCHDALARTPHLPVLVWRRSITASLLLPPMHRLMKNRNQRMSS